MSIHTEHFITEIQTRPCIWNTNCEEYSNRVLKQSAWNEIAEILCNDWSTLSEKIKTKKVQHLQKKWKGLRDYYNRERNKNLSSKSGSPSRKKRKTPLLDMLQFLNVRKINQTSSNIKEETTDNLEEEEDDDMEDSDTSSVYQNPKTEKIFIPSTTSTFEEALLKSIEKIENKKDDPDMRFLLTILPEMKSMTPSQNFEFRFEVMKVIKKIKYSDNYEHRREQPEGSGQN